MSFRQIEDFPRYSINKEGTVIESSTGKTINSTIYPSRNHPTVYIEKKFGKRTIKSVTQLLKETFPEMYEVTPTKDIIIHKEGTLPIDMIMSEDQLEIRRYFDYDMVKGCLYHKDTKQEAYSHYSDRYRVVIYKNTKWLEHVLIMIYMLGKKYPDYEIDHIDHNRANNSWNNLRIVNRAANSKNLSKHSTNTSGVTGVNWHKTKNKWRAYIMVNYKQIYLGLYEDYEIAVKVRKEAERKYGFHENHGK